MRVIDLRDGHDLGEAALAVGMRVRIDFSDYGAGLVSGTVTDLGDEQQFCLSGRSVRRDLVRCVEVIDLSQDQTSQDQLT